MRQVLQRLQIARREWLNLLRSAPNTTTACPHVNRIGSLAQNRIIDVRSHSLRQRQGADYRRDTNHYAQYRQQRAHAIRPHSFYRAAETRSDQASLAVSTRAQLLQQALQGSLQCLARWFYIIVGSRLY